MEKRFFMKNPKWRIGVTFSSHHVVDVEAESVEKACELAYAECEKDKEYYLRGVSKTITSVYVNDRESREFAAYVPEFYVRQQDEK